MSLLTLLRPQDLSPRDVSPTHTMPLQIVIRQLVLVDRFELSINQWGDRVSQFLDRIEVLS